MKPIYNRKFARSQWRKSFTGSPMAFLHSRQAGRDNSFRKFTGRCQN